VARRQWEAQMQRSRERPNLTYWRDQLDASAREPQQDPEVLFLLEFAGLKCVLG
jgi:hypothetical protein